MFEAWDIDARATLGQIAHGYLVQRAPVSSGPESKKEAQQNKEFYNMYVPDF